MLPKSSGITVYNSCMISIAIIKNDLLICPFSSCGRSYRVIMDNFDVILNGIINFDPLHPLQYIQFETLTVDLELYRWTVSYIHQITTSWDINS